MEIKIRKRKSAGTRAKVYNETDSGVKVEVKNGAAIILKYHSADLKIMSPPCTFYRTQRGCLARKAPTPQKILISLCVQDKIVECQINTSHRSTYLSPETTYSTFCLPLDCTATYQLDQIGDISTTPHHYCPNSLFCFCDCVYTFTFCCYSRCRRYRYWNK